MQLPLISAGTSSAPGQTTHLLIAHMRYMGKPEDFEKDMSKVGEDPETQRWWKVSSDLERGVPLGPGLLTRMRRVLCLVPVDGFDADFVRRWCRRVGFRSGLVVNRPRGLSFRGLSGYCRASLSYEACRHMEIFGLLLDLVHQHLPSLLDDQRKRASTSIAYPSLESSERRQSDCNKVRDIYFATNIS